MERPTKAETGASREAADSGKELRGAERLTLMLRVAKIVGDHGELPCIIRDVSATGVRLRLFHPLSDQARLALELANGDFYFVEKVWERGGEAGFRFSAPIDIPAFIAEASPYPRRPVRLRLRVPAVISSRGATHAASLRDLSQNGARIAAAAAFDFDQRLRIDTPGLPTIEARVRWRSHAECGVVFEQTIRLDDFARMVAALPREAADDSSILSPPPGVAAPIAQHG